jgi:hypothetical protein
MGPFQNEWTTEQVEAVLAKGNADDLLYVPIVVSMNVPTFDPARAEDICVELSSHADPRVRGNALKGLGHIARSSGSFGRKDSIGRIKAGLTDEDETVRSHAQDASSDIYMFTGLTISE